MTEIPYSPEKSSQIMSRAFLKAKEVVEKAKAVKKIASSKAFRLATTGSLLFLAACNSPQNINIDMKSPPTPTATATIEPTIQIPVEQQAFYDIFDINQAVKELVRPETLKRNPGLVLDNLYNRYNLQPYLQTGSLTESIIPTSKGKPGWTTIKFLPEQHKGPTGIYVTKDEKGNIYDKQIALVLSPDGTYIDTNDYKKFQIRPDFIPESDLQKVATDFFNIPKSVTLKWETYPYSTYGKQISGTADVAGKHYFVATSTPGTSLFAVSGYGNPPKITSR